MDEKLIETIRKIKLLADQNQEFRQEMQKLFGKTGSATNAYASSSIMEDVNAIRAALEIRAKPSITYGFVKNQRLRDQLIIDNLRMENAALNLKEPEADRFYTFCVNAFYQVENLLNLYYHSVFTDIDSMLHEIEDKTSAEGENFKFKRNNREENVGSIPIVHKINAFFNSYFPNDKSLKITFCTLRKVRNEGEHRCNTILQERDETNFLYKFFKNNTFNSLRIDLKKLVDSIESKMSLLSSTVVLQETIVSILPSACFVTFRGKNTSIPTKLLGKVKNLNIGDKIAVTAIGTKIIDINIE